MKNILALAVVLLLALTGCRTSLNYEGDSIHSNYNNWIQRLDNAIKTQLTLI